MNKFWNWKKKNVKNEAQKRTLFLNGTIAEESWFDDDVTPKLFKDELMAEDGDITVWINSPGGNVFAAAEIYTMLKDYKGAVTVKVASIAASAASVVATRSPCWSARSRSSSTVSSGDTAAATARCFSSAAFASVRLR